MSEEVCVLVCNHVYNIITSLVALVALGWTLWQHFQIKKHGEIITPKKEI